MFPTGYANEIGEAFKSHIPRVGYYTSYLVSSGYALGDASSKSLEMYKVSGCIFMFHTNIAFFDPRVDLCQIHDQIKAQ